MATNSEETVAIERCIRSFIIKSIYAIVQARNGNTYSTACISDVGARNNLMIYLEEDPEIGATIKQILDSGTPIKMGDAISLEILVNNAAGRLVVLEMWQFLLDTEDNLLRRGRLPCSRVVANHSGLQPSISPLPTTPSADNDVAASEVATLKCIAVEDFRRSRLFERLARLLESLIVTTRMLPGEVPLDRLGQDGVICRQVGHLFPGLAVGSSSVHLFLNVSVRYRGNLSSIDFEEGVHQPLQQPQRRSRSRRPCVRPAFATTLEDDEDFIEEQEDEEKEDDVSGLAYKICSEGLPESEVEGETIFDEATGFYYYYHDDEGVGETERCLSDSEDDEMSRTFVSDDDGSDSGRVRSRVPLYLPFSTVDLAVDGDPEFGVVGSGTSGGCARMAHLVSELRTKTDLDLFRVPGASTGSTATSSVFDANALGDELARHEKRLAEFDDFLASFVAAAPSTCGSNRY